MLVAVETDNLDKTYQAMQAKGVEFVEKPTNAPWGKQAVFRDLCGNQFDLIERRSIGEYIAGFPPEVQEILAKTRLTSRQAAPDAEETIEYQIPTFTLNGNLLGFAACKKHIGVYPVPAGDDKFRNAISAYKTGKSSARFPLDKPISFDLISKLVKFRVKEHSR